MHHLPRVRRLLQFVLLPVLVCCLALGCGGEKKYRVSGKVTFKGQPVPAGKIQFIPDKAKGNDGPGGYAEIKDGNYDTDAPGGLGSVGGAMIIRIDAFDPASTGKSKAGDTTVKTLFPTYQTSADLPKADGTKDFDVPESALKGTIPQPKTKGGP